MRKCLAIISALMLSASSAMGQNAVLDSLGLRWSMCSEWYSPEKLYLHMDRTYYTSGETIWFCGYLRNASSLAKLPESNYIYVELLDGDSEIVSRVKIKRSDDIFPGSMELPEDMKSGFYTLRAYTLWQMNRDSEWFFNQRVKILGGKAPKESVSTAADKIDVTFYPEGGRYFCGAASSIAFKAMDRRGRSVEVKGQVVDGEGNAITSARTLHDGMGSIVFFPTEGTEYFLELENGGKYAIPAPSDAGVSVTATALTGRHVINIRGTVDRHMSLLLRDISSVRRIADTDAQSSVRTFIVGDSQIREGINHLLLVDDSGKIISERLFYNWGDGSSRTSVNITTSGAHGDRRAPIHEKITLADSNGAALDGHFSVSIVRGSLSGYAQGDNLVSYMSLSSELRGHVNDPAWYFDDRVPSVERKVGMDLLMMVQGWTYYDLAAMTCTGRWDAGIKRGKEYMQAVHGHISRAVSSKVPKQFSIFVLCPAIHMSNYMEVEEGSRFIIDSLDFEDGTGFLVKISRASFGLGYIPKWDGDTFAPTCRYYPAPGMAYAAAPEEKIPLYNDVAMTDTLSAAVVTASDGMGELIDGRSASAEDMKFYKDRTLMEYIGYKSPGLVYENDTLINRRSGSPVKLIVDGTEQEWWVFENVYVSDIASISISTSPDSFYNSLGGTVAIKLKSGVNIENSSETQPSLVYFVPLGYQGPTYFYSPRYDKGDKEDGFDHRNTIYWNPCIKVRNGAAGFTFCDTDQQDYPYLIRVEGVTVSGVPFSCSRTI